MNREICFGDRYEVRPEDLLVKVPIAGEEASELVAKVSTETMSELADAVFGEKGRDECQ